MKESTCKVHLSLQVKVHSAIKSWLWLSRFWLAFSAHAPAFKPWSNAQALEQAAGSGAADDRTQELAELENEADMPLAQLLASYGFVMDGTEGAAEAPVEPQPAAKAPRRVKAAAAAAAEQDLDAMASSDSDSGVWLLC